MYLKGMSGDLEILSGRSYKELLRCYQENFSLGYFNTDIKNKFALISLICYVTYKAKEKKPDVTHYEIIMQLTKNQSLPDAMVKRLAVICDDFAYGCTEFPTFELKGNAIVQFIKDILNTYVPF